MKRRRFLYLTVGAAAYVAAPHIAHAQSYPARSISVLVFVPAGGAPDIIARLIAQALSQRLGQPVVIDNRPGGGGNVALQAVARAPADGYTLLLVATPYAINATLYEKLNISVANDIAPIVGINRDSFVMLINPSLPVRTVPEFIAYAKANPGKINMASSGTGNLSHLSAELFKMMAGLDMVHVPYKGTVPALAGVIAGEVHLMFDAVPSALPHVQSGRLRALATTLEARTRALPEVPPLSDILPGYSVSGWLGLGVPKDTPPDIVERLNRETNAVVADPAIRARLTDLGSDVLGGSPADFGKFVAGETAKWAKVIHAANIRVE
jgi:tripartite-type tricarboxylate transporter receptor subunit TctC